MDQQQDVHVAVTQLVVAAAVAEPAAMAISMK